MKHLPQVEWRHREGLTQIVAALGGDAQTRIVGGAIRDTLIGLEVSDIDVATVYSPPRVVEALAVAGIKAVPTGIAHGTVTAVTADGPIEITTLRRDITTDGRHATVAFTDDWRADAARRDFTINALFGEQASGTIHDYFDGLDDIAAGRVRFIGAPLARIAEDHLRILRFYRFHARFGRGEPDAAAVEACVTRANDLMALSRERISSELLKLLVAAAPGKAVALMVDGEILTPVLPEINVASVARLDRLVIREAAFGTPGNPIRRLAALIGPSPELASAIAARLRLSKVQAKRLEIACGWRVPGGAVSALAYAHGRAGASDRLLLGDGEATAMSALDNWARPELPISGGDLIERGLVPGPLVSKTLQAIEHRWVAAGFPDGPAFDTIVDAALRKATSV